MDKFITAAVFLFASSFFISCGSQKYLVKHDEVYTYSAGGNDPGNRDPRFTKYKIKHKVAVDIVDNGTYLIIQMDPTTNTNFAIVKGYPKTFIKTPTTWKIESRGSCYFSETEDQHPRKVLKYLDGTPVLQTATIPLKIRPAIRTPELKDSIPSTTEAGFNVGFLVGYKFSLNRFNGKSNIFGQTTQKLSVTPGAILSFGTADLSPAATRPAIAFERTAPMITFGGSVVLGFNSINIGYAIGWDNALGSSASTWLYRGKMWNGIIISLDLIK